jgi:hypothetical protein
MQSATFRVVCLASALASSAAFAIPGASSPAEAAPQSSARFTARITMADGRSRVGTLEGIGCSASICSRTGLKGRDRKNSLVNTRFYAIRAITDTTATDALLVLKDGTQTRLSLVNDFRVLYIANRFGTPDRIDLANVRSVEFAAFPK